MLLHQYFYKLILLMSNIYPSNLRYFLGNLFAQIVVFFFLADHKIKRVNTFNFDKYYFPLSFCVIIEWIKKVHNCSSRFALIESIKSFFFHIFILVRYLNLSLSISYKFLNIPFLFICSDNLSRTNLKKKRNSCFYKIFSLCTTEEQELEWNLLLFHMI